MASLMQVASWPLPSSSSLQYFSISFSHWPAKGEEGGTRCFQEEKGVSKIENFLLRTRLYVLPLEAISQLNTHTLQQRLASLSLTLVVDVVPEFDLRSGRELDLLVVERGLLHALAACQALLHCAVGRRSGGA